MKPINDKPIDVDFNNLEKDNAVRLHLPVTIESLKENKIQLKEGLILWVTDGETEMLGTVTLRNGIWVAIPDKNGFKDVK